MSLVSFEKEVSISQCVSPDHNSIDSTVYNKRDKSHVSALDADDNDKGYELGSVGFDAYSDVYTLQLGKCHIVSAKIHKNLCIVS
ncbi:Hypothetical predicted protein [Octopus vulgaris]|uniref:Uncharacterized protein n=1 Tax=Octopus vulgaris TaxID=6645 RepID=A0AA36ASB5_OCTVU|nr:Hypothetical predicted protein [Octopus vulgaris]